jgi:glycosyltransferase involved in cell wall biosynthesis
VKNISYWSPILSNIATLKAVSNSAMSLAKYSNDYKVTLLNSVGEFEKFRNKNNKVRVFDLEKKLLSKTLIGIGFFKTRISMIIIFFKCFFPLKNYLNKEKPDYLIIHLLTSLPLLLFLLFEFKSKCILRISGLPKMNFLRLFFWKICSKKIHMITCPTNLTRDYLIKLNFIEKNKIITLHDPILDIKKYSYLKKQKIEKNKNFFFSAGRLTKQKNFSFLINCLSNLNKELLIAGEGELKADLKDQILKNKNKKISLLGHQDNILKYMKQSEAFILPSLWEDPGFVIIEAAFCRALIISSDCKNGPIEFVSNDCGILFKTNDTIDFEKKFKYFQNLNLNQIKTMKLNALKKTRKYTIFNHFIALNKILIR